jgi:VanZ family protein
MLSWPLPRPLRTAIFGAATAVLLWVSLAPTEDLPQSIMFWDKAEHALAYLVLTGLGVTLFPRHRVGVAAYAFTLAVLVELLQGAMGLGRSCDWRDAAAGTVGIAAALAVEVPVRRWLQRR